MALLTKEQREKRFKYLGLGEYNKENLLKFQKKAFPNMPKEQDSKYGEKTDRALRTFYNVKKYGGGYFKPQEFRCNCGHCSGYPSYMKKVQIQHLKKIREHYKKPMTITSGLRCAYENNRVGGVANSGHTRGYATDFYAQGVTDTLPNRRAAISWIKQQDNHEFSYGNGIDSYGKARSAAGMGNALHTETHKPVKTPQDKICDEAKAIADSGKYRYVFFNSKYGKECAICHPHDGKNKGWQCIGYAIASWHHSGINCKCNCEVFTNQIWEQMMKTSTDNATAIAKKRLGISSVKVLRSKNGIPLSKLQKGDIIAYFVGAGYKHTAIYIGNGKIADCTSTRNISIKYGVKSYTKMTIKVAVRYTGR